MPPKALKLKHSQMHISPLIRTLKSSPSSTKIDLPIARPDEVKREIEEIIGIPAEDAILVSAKQGIGTQEVLESIVRHIPPPGGDTDAPLKALVIDSLYNSYRGVVMYIRVFDGAVKAGDSIRLMATGKSYEVEEVGIFLPALETG